MFCNFGSTTGRFTPLTQGERYSHTRTSSCNHLYRWPVSFVNFYFDPRTNKSYSIRHSTNILTGVYVFIGVLLGYFYWD